MKSLFWKEEMELTLVGLQNSGKTTFVNVIGVSQHFPRIPRHPPLRPCMHGGPQLPTQAPLFSNRCSAPRHTTAQSGSFSEDMIPTVGFNMRKVTKGNVVIKVRPFASGAGLFADNFLPAALAPSQAQLSILITPRLLPYSLPPHSPTPLPQLWDIGGQPRFRTMWERYCRGVQVIMYMVDSADPSKLEAAKQELHTLIEKPQLAGIPVLVLGNKNDLPKAMGVEDLIEALYVVVAEGGLKGQRRRLCDPFLSLRLSSSP